MKDTVEVEIDRPLREVANLYGEPRNSPKWMHDIKGIEAVHGELGAVGSQYRLVPKRGSMVFVATVVERELPGALRLTLESRSVDVDVRGTLEALSPARTRLVSAQTFAFKGVFGRLFAVLARPAIHKAHRRHMEDFKRFAERR